MGSPKSCESTKRERYPARGRLACGCCFAIQLRFSNQQLPRFQRHTRLDHHIAVYGRGIAVRTVGVSTAEIMPTTKNPVMTITVILASGAGLPHEYAIQGKTVGQMLSYIDSVLRPISDALKSDLAFILSNPTRVYNPRHVAALEFGAIDVAELEELVRKQTEGMGFVRD